RQGRNQRALGQTTMTDFTALGRTEAAGFTGGERREVVMQHETITVLAHDRVNYLFVLLGTQGGDHQGLGFTTREQSAAVRTGKHAQADADGTYSTRVTTVDTRLTVQDLAAHNLGFKIEQHVFDFDIVGGVFA